MASLSWLERKVSSALFGSPPEATYQDALNSLQTAHRLKKDWKANHCFIAKTFIAMGKYRDAIKWIDSGLAVPVQTKEDELIEVELKQLEKSYAKYR